MGVITLDDGRTFKVDDSFGKLPADQQQAIVGELKQQLTGGVAKEIASGTAPVKTTLQSAAENFVPSAKNLVSGAADTAVAAGKALINPNPMAKVEFIKDQAVGIWDTLKKRYGGGIENAIATDPAGVLADVVSLGAGLRGVRSGGGVEVPTRAATRANAIVRRDMATDVANQTATGVGPTPMDRGGTAIANQVERLSNTSAGGRDVLEPFLTERQSGQFGRITEDLKTLAGSTRTARAALDETVAAQQKAATPLYQSAYAAGDREIWSPELERLTSAPSVKSAMQGAQSGWRDNAIANGYGAMNPTQIDRGGQIKYGKSVPVFPNVQFWDYTKASLDRAIDAEIKPDGRLTRHGRDLTIIKNKLVDELDKQVPEYAAARKAWAGPASYMNALEFGQSIFREPADNFVADFNKLSNADKQAAREAAASKIVADLGKSSTEIGANLRDLTARLKNREMVQKVLAILPDQQSRASWVQKLRAEVRSSELVGRGLKNSATARRLAQAQEASDLVGDMVLGFIKGDVIGTKARLIAGGWKRVKDKIQAKTDREMANILTGQTTSTKIQNPVGNRAPLLAPALTSQEQQ